jgi:serine/threonine protein kinase
LTSAARVTLVTKLADAVQHAHERGVIHRDLKPANVLVADGGQPKVLDFGIARATGADVERMTIQTAHGQLMGTLAYMSPEQLRGRSAEVDARSDVYALGVLIYRLLTERLPFDVSALTWPEAIRHVLEADPMPIGRVNALLGGSLEQIVARAMSRDVRDRYQTAADFAADLQRFLDGHQPAATASVTSTRSDGGLRSRTGGHERWSADVEGVRALAASPDGRFIALGLASGSIELRDVDTGALMASFAGHHGPVVALTFCAENRILAVWEEGRVAALAFQRADC